MLPGDCEERFLVFPECTHFTGSSQNILVDAFQKMLERNARLCVPFFAENFVELPKIEAHEFPILCFRVHIVKQIKGIRYSHFTNTAIFQVYAETAQTLIINQAWIEFTEFELYVANLNFLHFPSPSKVRFGFKITASKYPTTTKSEMLYCR